jgi:CubicO group peptidase (beta-lactamase class C family)
VATNAAFDALAGPNPAASLSVWRDGREVLTRATGTTIDGAPATADSPMVVASVSKVVTANLIARLDQQGMLDVDRPLPWIELGMNAHPAWADVTPRELLDHTSGMPVVRRSWFGQPGDCRSHLADLLVDPPQGHRGRWTYSNGNYCALGLLAETVTGLTLDGAAQQILFDPIDAEGVHLTTGGQLPTDVASPLGVDRLSRLGGAGSLIVSTADLAALLAAVTPADRNVMRWPGMMSDQYGWGHTGTVDGAKACVWVLESGRTVMAATVAGDRPSTGGAVCDQIVVALATDLGLAAGTPDRTPR